LSLEQVGKWESDEGNCMQQKLKLVEKAAENKIQQMGMAEGGREGG